MRQIQDKCHRIDVFVAARAHKVLHYCLCCGEKASCTVGWLKTLMQKAAQLKVCDVVQLESWDASFMLTQLARVGAAVGVVGVPGAPCFLQLLLGCMTNVFSLKLDIIQQACRVRVQLASHGAYNSKPCARRLCCRHQYPQLDPVWMDVAGCSTEHCLLQILRPQFTSMCKTSRRLS